MSLSARILLDHLSQLNIEKQILCREEQRERILRKRATVNASFYVFPISIFSVIVNPKLFTPSFSIVFNAV